ncbi:MAG: ATP-binding protein [Acidobacteriota bacterium]|nr:ATP-binding protein [Acidobacteriota bacterium]
MSPQLERSHPASDTELFRALFDHALDAVLISDDRGVYVQANGAACELIGAPCEEILGRPVAEFFDMRQTQSVDDAWGSFLEQGTMQGECWVRRVDGQQRCCSFRAKANFVPGLHMSFLRDITDQKEAIQALQNSNRKLSLLSNVSRELLANYRPRTLLKKLFTDICTELGLEVYLKYLVHEGTRLRLDSCGGIAAEKMAQHEWLDFGQGVCGTVAAERTMWVVEDVQNSTDPLTKLIRSLGIQAYVCHPLLHGDELLGTLSFGSRTRPEFRADELQLMRIVADGIAIALYRAQLISDLESNNTELKRTNEELGQSNAELYHFAYAVGHDLKAPLRTVASFAQLLTRRLDTQDGEVQEFVSIINNAVHGMNKFLDDLLRYAQLGSITKRQYPVVDSKLVLEWALINLSSEVQRTNATITQGHLPEIQADQSQMVQLFQNLIGNALKYATNAAPLVHVSSSREETATTFSIKDNGVGIDPKYHDEIFGIFKRLHGADTPGSGIGLALCKRIVENHGGRIWVESAGQAGSTFYFTVPDQPSADSLLLPAISEPN